MPTKISQLPDSGFSSLTTDVPIAPLQTIDLDRLAAKNEEEIEKLLHAAILDGVFYLNLGGVIARERGVMDAAHDIYKLSEKLFALDEDEKLLYDIDEQPDRWSALKLSGYKPIGRNIGGISNNRDGFESYAIPKDGMLGLKDSEHFPRLPIIDSYSTTMQSFMTSLQQAGQFIFEGLSLALEMDSSEVFESFHRLGVSSPDILRLLKYHPQPKHERGSPQTPHTDLGSLTFLFTRQAGLQVLKKGDDEWAYVEPKEDHAIVNLGDAMSLFSGGILQSCLHRISPLPFKAFETRYSFAYMLRPENSAIMKALTSPVIPQNAPNDRLFTSEEWLTKKFETLRKGTHKQKNNWVLTGSNHESILNV